MGPPRDDSPEREATGGSGAGRRATLHTSLPKDAAGHRGELDLALRLAAIARKDAHLWFNMRVPGGTEIDVLLVDESVGAFVIEVKSVSLEMVTSYDMDSCVIQGRAQSGHPLQQAAFAMEKLRFYLKDVGIVRPPFLFATAAFPLIDRASLIAKFAADGGIAARAIAMQLEGLLFREDLVNERGLIDRLDAIVRRPPRGSTPKRRPYPTRGQVDELIEATTGRASKVAPRAVSGDPDRARKIALIRDAPRPSRKGQFDLHASSPSKASIARYVTPGAREPVIFTGPPGSGKSQALLDVAFAHARAGRRVLFTCYNKTLASSIRQRLAATDAPRELHERVLVADIYDLDYSKYQRIEPVMHPLSRTFETICVDEAQDIPTPEMEFLRGLAKPRAEWFLADGPGQELYERGKDEFSPGSALVARARRGGVIQRLQKRFSTMSPAALVARAAFELSLEPAEVGEWVSRHPVAEPTSETGAMFEAAVGPGELPILRRVKAGTDVVMAYAAQIREELEIAADAGDPFGLMVLVASGKSVDAADVRASLAAARVSYLDQSSSEDELGLRRAPLGREEVRLVTAHSARGLQSTRAILFGIDKFKFGGTPVLMPDDVTRNAAYIALTRASHGTRIVTVEGREESKFQLFLEALLEAYAPGRGSADLQAPEEGLGLSHAESGVAGVGSVVAALVNGISTTFVLGDRAGATERGYPVYAISGPVGHAVLGKRAGDRTRFAGGAIEVLSIN